jgi:hypothetical protein
MPFCSLTGGTAIMPKFRVGDEVDRIGTLVPPYMRSGIVTKVIPNKDGMDWFKEYEVNFGNKTIAKFYETQLRLVNQPTEPHK